MRDRSLAARATFCVAIFLFAVFYFFAAVEHDRRTLPAFTSIGAY